MRLNALDDFMMVSIHINVNVQESAYVVPYKVTVGLVYLPRSRGKYTRPSYLSYLLGQYSFQKMFPCDSMLFIFLWWFTFISMVTCKHQLQSTL